jgi:hypothetical protein
MKFLSKNSVASLLISSDYYFHECLNFNPQNFREFEQAIRRREMTDMPLKIFIDGVSAIQFFSKWNGSISAGQVEIYVHRGDIIPQAVLFEKMQKLNFKLYSVNWLGNLDICKPIPIGIPAKSAYGYHGRLIQQDLLESSSQLDRLIDHEIYLNYDLTTNIIERKSALAIFYGLKDVYIPFRRLSKKENLRKIAHSRYVISPPGAGADCYRTWEAIYLGAIPVVLRKFWPFGHLELPVKVVESYAQFLAELNETVSTKSPRVTSRFISELPNKFR